VSVTPVVKPDNTKGGHLYSYDSGDYAGAVAGDGTLSTQTGKYQYVGQTAANQIYVNFIAFDLSELPADLDVDSVTLKLRGYWDYTTDDFTLQVRGPVDYGGSVGSNDWMSPTDLSNATLLATYDTSGGWSNGLNTTVESGTALTDAVDNAAGGWLYLVVCSDQHVAESAPSNNEYVGFYYGNYHELHVTYQDTDAKKFLLPKAASGYLGESDGTYSTCRAFGSPWTNTTEVRAGQRYAGSYECYEGFIAFDLSALSGETIADATIWAGGLEYDYGDVTVLNFREYDWGTSVTSGDLIACDDLDAETLLASLDCSTDPIPSAGWGVATSEAAMVTAVQNALGGDLRMVVATSRLEAGTTPTTYECVHLTKSFGSYWATMLVVELQTLTPVNDDLSGSHRVLELVDDDLDGSHGVQEANWTDDDLDGSHVVRAYVDDDLDGSHRLLVLVDGDLSGSHRLLVAVDDDLDGSHVVWAYVDDDLEGLHEVWEAGVPAREPLALWTPQLSLVVGNTNDRVDLVAEGADVESLRYGNSVLGGHTALTIEVPQRPSRLLANYISRGEKVILQDAGRTCWEGVVKKLSGNEAGQGRSMTTFEACGPLDLAELDESFRWVWVDADYAGWFEVPPMADTVEHSWLDAFATTQWDPWGWDEAPFEVRTDGELFIGAIKGTTYGGDPFYKNPARARIAYRIDHSLDSFASGSYAEMGQVIKGFRYSYRCDVGTRFKARVMACTTPWDEPGSGSLVSHTGDGTSSQREAEDEVGYPCIVVELSFYYQSDYTSDGSQFIQLLHPRVLVRPDGPGTRSWVVDDALPRLDEAMTDILLDGDDVLATEVDAEEIGDGKSHLVAEGPTRRAALEQLSDFDEDEDGTGQPLEWGIWDGQRGLIRRRPADPDRQNQWLAIDAERDDVLVEVAYQDALDAPDYVEVRYQYRRTDLIRYGSPAAAGVWEARGQANGAAPEWGLTGTIDKDTIGGKRYWKMSDGATMTYPEEGTYPLVSTRLAAAYPTSVDDAVLPFIMEHPLRFQFWAKGHGYVVVNFRLKKGTTRGSDTLFNGSIGDSIDSGSVTLTLAEWIPDPSSGAYEMQANIHASGGTLWWRDAGLYLLIPDGEMLSAWYPEQPQGAGHSVKTYDLSGPHTIWEARNSARRFWRSFRRGTGQGTIEARGVLYDVKGRQVALDQIRGGWWASVVNDPRCTAPLYVSGVECAPGAREATLSIGGEVPAWSERRSIRERRTYGRYADWRGFRYR